MGASVSAPPGLHVGDAAGRWVLLATVLGSGMAMLDATVVNLALPRMAADLDASFTGLQWILNGYTLTLAALILLGGALGDRYGRRRIFLLGAGWFTVASVACAVAPSVEVLVVARVAQGAGAALLAPGSLAILQASFDPHERGRAIGLWSGLGGVATAVGPFLGGWLVDVASWRWIFLINVPLGITVIAVGRPTSRRRGTRTPPAGWTGWGPSSARPRWPPSRWASASASGSPRWSASGCWWCSSSPSGDPTRWSRSTSSDPGCSAAPTS